MATRVHTLRRDAAARRIIAASYKSPRSLEPRCPFRPPPPSIAPKPCSVSSPNLRP
ncbi:protein of unknown function [Burkholderia multivorans]